MQIKRFISVLFLLVLVCNSIRAQVFLISQIFSSNPDELAVYSISIRNISRDSIMVLHTEEAQNPPFINTYRWNEEDTPSSKLLLEFGKSINPLLPEKYRATKTLATKKQIELYFAIPKKYNGQPKKLEIWYSMLEKKFFEDFEKLENTNSNATVDHCKKIKQKFGKVHSKFIAFY